MNKIHLIFISCLLFSTCMIRAQENMTFYETAVYDENIKTMLMSQEDNELSIPIIVMGEGNSLIFKFDDLSGKVKNYYYTIIHCDAEWNESFIMKTEYLDGFSENPVDDYARSFNTTFDYINYRIYLPNDDVKFKISGNYVLLVYEEGNRQNVVLSQRFYVVEPLVSIVGTVKRATTDAYKGENQEVDFSVIYKRFKIDNPMQDIKVVVMKNNRWDNVKINLKPVFIKENELVYDYNRENVFVAGNEYRYFDIRSKRINGENVVKTEFYNPYFHKILAQDEIRANRPFFSYQEMNGKYVIQSQDRQVEDYDTECDYYFVHFTLPMKTLLSGGAINVFGDFSYKKVDKTSEMTWNYNTNSYELTLLLKQGYYNYMYVYVPYEENKVDEKNIEGSYWQTENDYQIFVYYKGVADRYDRLIGYRQLNSLKNRF